MSYRDLEICKLARQVAIDHLELLFETSSLTNEVLYRDLSAQLDLLRRKLNVFIDAVWRSHRTDRTPISHHVSPITHLAS